jgi:hypothetical protein
MVYWSGRDGRGLNWSGRGTGSRRTCAVGDGGGGGYGMATTEAGVFPSFYLSCLVRVCSPVRPVHPLLFLPCDVLETHNIKFSTV